MGSRKKRLQRKTEAAVRGAPSEPVKHLPAVLMLAFAGLMWHGFLLTNDGLIWDSWYVKSWLEEKNWRALSEFFGSVGLPVYGWLYMPFAYAPDIVGAFMVATVLCLLTGSLLTYLLGVRLGGLTPGESLCVALLAQAMPTFTAGQDFIMFFFVFMHTLFLAAALLAVMSLEVRGRRRIVLRVAALLIFFASFYNAALLVFYGGFFLLLFFKWRRGNPSPWLQGAISFCFTHADFFLLPPLAWILRQITTPQFGWYEDYNSPLANLPFILPSLRSFFVNVIPYHTTHWGIWVLSHPVVTGGIILTVIASGLHGSKGWICARSRITSLPMGGFAVILLFLAIFPYAAAGKGFSPVPVGEPSRYTILTGLPLALLVFTGVRLVLLRKEGSTSRWLLPACAGFAVVLGCQIPQVYVRERSEWITNLSVLTNVKHSERIRASSVILLTNCTLSHQTAYATYAFHSVFGDFTRLVTGAPPANGAFFTPSEISMHLRLSMDLPSVPTAVDPSGQQIVTMVNTTQQFLPAWDMCVAYFWLKHTSRADAVLDFLSGLTALHCEVIKPRATPPPLS